VREGGGQPALFARDRYAWRAWLTRHHASEPGVWLLLFKKHTGRPCITLDMAVEEALCFGWIDGKLRRVYDERHIVRFTPHRPDSVWSESNKARVRRLIAAGRMTAAGLRLVDAAKRSGQWRLAAERDRSPRVPHDLVEALGVEPQALGFFAGLAPSYRKMYIGWVLAAKREDTRRRRIRTVVERARRGLKPGIDLRIESGVTK
jgi:uncharacterized protein YdeI (YjbR/CyaY-like superfamily)